MGGADSGQSGAVLLKLGLGLSEDATCPEFAERALLKEATTKKPYAIRVVSTRRDTSGVRRKWTSRHPYVKVSLWE